MAFGAQPADSNNIPIASSYNPVTALFKAIRGVNKQTDASSNDSVAIAMSPEDGYKATYSASYKALAGVAGDLFQLIGSSTKTVKLIRLEISGTASAAVYLDMSVEMRSTAGTPGTTVTAASKASYDSTNAAATATASAFSAAGTPGTSLGIIRANKLLLQAAATFTVPEQIVWEFGVTPAQCPTLRGVAQNAAVVMSALPSSGLIDFTCTWTEE